MIFSENRYTLFRIMLNRSVTARSEATASRPDRSAYRRTPAYAAAPGRFRCASPRRNDPLVDRTIHVSLMLMSFERPRSAAAQVSSMVSAEGRRRGRSDQAAGKGGSLSWIDWDQFPQASSERKMRSGVNKSNEGRVHDDAEHRICGRCRSGETRPCHHERVQGADAATGRIRFVWS
jgi:hypothetical protein